MIDPSFAPLQNSFCAAGRMGFLNANHVMSLFCSKPFIGFLHIQSKTLLKCWQGLALAIALFFFFFFTSHLQHHQLLSQVPSLHPTHRHSGILSVCQTHQEENSHPGTSASAVPTGLRPSFSQKHSSELHLIQLSLHNQHF